MENSETSPLSIIAFGIAISIGIIAIGFAISIIVTAAGLAIGVGSGAQILNDLLSLWFTRLAGVGLAAGGATVFIKTVVDSREKIVEKPKQWVIPILAIAAGFLVEIDKTFVAEGVVTKILFSGLAVLMIYVGSVIFERKEKVWKSCGVVLIFLPPIIVLVGVIFGSTSESLQKAFAEVSPQEWVAFILVSILTGLVLWISTLSNEDVD